jgi:hypothetical protein
MAITQQSYLDDSSSVKAARKKLTAAKAALADAKKAEQGLANVPNNKQLAAQIKKRIDDAQEELKSVTEEVTAVETKARNYFDKNKDAILAKAAEKETAAEAAATESLNAQIARMKEAGLDTSAIENIARNKKKKSTQEAEEETNGGAGNGGAGQTADDFAGMLKTSTKFIKDMSGPERKQLAKQLNDAIGAGLVVSELVDPGSLLAAYNGAIAAAKARYDQFKDIPTLEGFLNQKKLETAAIKSAGGSGAEKPWGQIYDKTQAKSLISNVITSVLGRDATAKEISGIASKLMDAQAKNPFKKNAQGMTVGGLNAEQFVTDLVKAMPEYETKKLAKEDLTTRDLAETARLNGLKLGQTELKSYSDRVKNGEDIKVIENEIRTVAGMGQPDSIKRMLAAGTNLDTIYSPYKRTLATSLGINPDTITLDDPTLRMAIGPDKEMSLYDYKKAIRQDSRWKYSEEANDEVSEMINQVKRDFGFMG